MRQIGTNISTNLVPSLGWRFAGFRPSAFSYIIMSRSYRPYITSPFIPLASVRHFEDAFTRFLRNVGAFVSLHSDSWYMGMWFFSPTVENGLLHLPFSFSTEICSGLSLRRTTSSWNFCVVQHSLVCEWQLVDWSVHDLWSVVELTKLRVQLSCNVLNVYKLWQKRWTCGCKFGFSNLFQNIGLTQ